MSKFISSPSELIEEGKRKNTTWVFLAGPIQGVHDWQRNDIPDLGPDITLVCPRALVRPESWESQVNWETEALRISDFVLFWVPPEEEHVEGRDYAQTTKIELIENLVRGKNIVAGIHPSIHTRRYLAYKYKSYTGREIHDNLRDTVKELQEMIKKRKSGTFFTSDTHFGSLRALELSKRPFDSVSEMDWTMIERWNKVVTPDSQVIHLGDFGNYSYLKYLNGDITIFQGNYEEEGKDEVKIYPSQDVTFIDEPRQLISVDGINLWAGHKPLDVKPACGEISGIFGHIHGRQKIKSWGIDVGVDGNNFTPMSLEDIKFYLEAIKKHYDSEVWS